MQKNVNHVDLVKSFLTSIYLQRSASIQPRTSLSKSGGDSIHSLVSLENTRTSAPKFVLPQGGSGQVRHLRDEAPEVPPAHLWPPRSGTMIGEGEGGDGIVRKMFFFSARFFQKMF